MDTPGADPHPALAATAPGESTLKQTSLSVRPVSTLPPTCSPS
jgi:hypothetical protein